MRRFHEDRVYSELCKLHESGALLEPIELAKRLNNTFDLNWSEGTEKRVGYSLASWYRWATEK